MREIRKEDVERIYFIERELEAMESRLENLQEDGGLKSPLMDGMPRGKTISDVTGNRATRNADNKVRDKLLRDTEKAIQDIIVRLEKQRLDVIRYISSLDDPVLETIIMYRCFDRCTWQEVATKMGGGYTEAAVKQTFHRHFNSL